MKPWKGTEEQFLRKNYKAMGAQWCAENMPGRTVSTIYTRARALGIATPRERLANPSNPQLDAAITRAYQSEQPSGFVKELAGRVGQTPSWVSRRAVALGLVAATGRTPWTEAEIEFANARPLLTAQRLSESMKRKGWHRTPGAVSNMRTHRMIETEDPGKFSANSLAIMMGVHINTVMKWVDKGLLIATKRGIKRNNGDFLTIDEFDVARFIVENVAMVSLAKLEPNKEWFVDLMSRCSAPSFIGMTSKSKRILALVADRPELTNIQIAEMLDTTANIVSVVKSQNKAAKQIAAAA